MLINTFSFFFDVNCLQIYSSSIFFWIVFTNQQQHKSKLFLFCSKLDVIKRAIHNFFILFSKILYLLNLLKKNFFFTFLMWIPSLFFIVVKNLSHLNNSIPFLMSNTLEKKIYFYCKVNILILLILSHNSLKVIQKEKKIFFSLLPIFLKRVNFMSFFFRTDKNYTFQKITAIPRVNI